MVSSNFENNFGVESDIKTRKPLGPYALSKLRVYAWGHKHT